MSAVLADVKLCSRDETQELHRRLGQTGDPAAREALVERYQGLVRRLAGQYNSGREGFDDLVQIGNIGLLNALDRFDPERGLPFRAFAIPTILGELRRYFRNTRWAVHMPRPLQERCLLVERAAEQLTGALSRTPTAVDVARKLDLTEEQVLEAFAVRHGYDVLSLDPSTTTEDGDDDLTLLDTLGKEEHRYELVADCEVVAATLRALPPREQEILRLRFVEDLTQTEIAERVGISQMQVSRLLRRSLARLRVVAEAAEQPTA
jgi:RNA polymerase sigma-B factor